MAQEYPEATLALPESYDAVQIGERTLQEPRGVDATENMPAEDWNRLVGWIAWPQLEMSLISRSSSLEGALDESRITWTRNDWLVNSTNGMISSPTPTDELTYNFLIPDDTSSWINSTNRSTRLTKAYHGTSMSYSHGPSNAKEPTIHSTYSTTAMKEALDQDLLKAHLQQNVAERKMQELVNRAAQWNVDGERDEDQM
ncbi:hypothetical protein GLOTRDRAFT_97006 [Gloeophyllum trabeum ATCC 11539]|uniref:Uncharacterized protein n=1 Tax=Gloeophyllum trabeum (strain ATCC 11539 / FP-39264 / Madison 617) TaxID=670483 RepID=S7RDP6_GLOTA|nr:uncharacterized protein GLOTRDRAFT_97006 [Gloeophyllum trabeum ATCC 11539]EPQ50554.1 hypothetical protein GLOTRDRAFT_97006 [Gloeophyllum trabeum ATCC 11539]